MSLESDGTSSPSSTLRESFMHLLESRKDSIDVLGKELKIDTTQFKAVREVVSTYEERDGRELSQNKWASIFKSLGCSEEFKTLLERDYVLLDMTSLEKFPPKNVSSQAQESLHKKSRESELLSKPGDLLETGGMPLNAPLSLAVSASSLPTVSSGSAIQDPVGQYHQATTTDTHGTDEAEENISSSQSNTDGSLSSDDSSTQSRPFTPQAANSPQLHRLHPSNQMAGEANAVVNCDGPDLTRSLPVVPSRSGTDEAEGGSLSSDDSRTQARPFTPQAANSPSVHARFAMQDPVGQFHWGMAREMRRDEEENSNQPSENDDETQDMNILQQKLELISVQLRQLQEHELQLKEELNYARRNNETLSHRMTELTQAANNNIEVIGAEFRQLHERKLRLEEKLEHTMRHNETLSHQMAERAQASDNAIQRLEQQYEQAIQRLEQQYEQLCEQKDQEYDAVLELCEQKVQEYEHVVEVIKEKNQYLEQLKRNLEEQQHLLSTVLEENHQLWLLVVGKDNASDGSDLTVVEAGEESDDSEEVFEDALDHSELV